MCLSQVAAKTASGRPPCSHQQGMGTCNYVNSKMPDGLTGYRGRSSGWAQTCAMACICGSAYSCMASPSLEDLCSTVVRVLTVLKLSSCCGSAHPCFLQHAGHTIMIFFFCKT